MKQIIIAGILIIYLSGCGQMSSPKDYDDCILINMKGVDSDLGADQIRRSCRKKFPEGSEYKNKERELEPSELMSLTGRAGLGYSNRYSGSIYNGNENTTITSVKFKVKTKNGDQESSREYQVNIKIPPLTTSDFGFDIIVGDTGSEYSWNIVGGKGFK